MSATGSVLLFMLAWETSPIAASLVFDGGNTVQGLNGACGRKFTLESGIDQLKSRRGEMVLAPT